MLTRACALGFALLSLWAVSGHTQELPPGVTFKELRARNGGRVWVYLPPRGPTKTKVGCVVVPPAGSRLFHGMALSPVDRKEHLPYVAAGFAVVSFDISGAWDDAQGAEAQEKALAAFLNSRCGVDDGLDAVQLALARFKQIDANRLYVAGHSSAGTLALQMAASTNQFKACAVFAPVADVEAHLGAKLLKLFERTKPGIAETLRQAAPINRLSSIQCPIFLFHARDDTVVPPESVVAFRKALQNRDKTVEYRLAESGGHYDSMLREGIPQAISWLQALDQKDPGR